MRTNGFTHVSVHTYDVDELVRFYTELFEMEEIPAPNFPSPVRCLRIGDLQLHLFKSDATVPQAHHFGLDVDGFEAIYQKANELGVAEGKGASQISTNYRTGRCNSTYTTLPETWSRSTGQMRRRSTDP